MEIRTNRHMYTDLGHNFQDLCAIFERSYHNLIQNLTELSDELMTDEREGRPGRPRVLINRQQLEALREIHFSWSSIARLLGVSGSVLCAGEDWNFKCR